MVYKLSTGLQKSSRGLKKYIFGAIAATLAAAALAIPVSAATPFSNGSFESGTDPGSFTELTAPDSTTITNWTVSSGTVDYIGTYWTASNGSRSLDMDGSGPGAIQQSFATTAGHTYTVTFDMAGNPDGGAGVKTMTVDTGGAPTTYSFTVSTQTKSNMGWTPENYAFTATGPATNLRFTSTTSGPYGPALDNVVVTDVTSSVKNIIKIKNHNHVSVTNTNTQVSSTGNATVKNNTTGGNATSGDSTNTNSSTTTVTITNNMTF